MKNPFPMPRFQTILLLICALTFVILYFLLSGTPPFNGNNDQEVIEAVKRG